MDETLLMCELDKRFIYNAPSPPEEEGAVGLHLSCVTNFHLTSK